MTSPGDVAEFDEFELDFARFELRRRGVPVQIERQVFDLLAYLVRTAGRVVTKEELLDNVWGTRFVTESALTTQIKFARRALGDDGTRQRFIRTVHRRGYAFIADPDPDPQHPHRSEPPLGADPAAVAGRSVPRLVGRDGSIADVIDLVATSRLVTITGPGGVGKTQLALTVAAQLADQFSDGVIQVDLTALTDPADVARAAAEAAGIGRREGAAVADALAETRALVVLDNCEHLVDGIVDFVERLLARPNDPVRILATTRVPLAAFGEQIYHLDPLAVDGVSGQASPAARLFIERAGRAVTGDDLPAIEELVVLLDGLPLAIELAAAQLGFMQLAELHRRLAQHRYSLEHRRREPSRHDSLADSVAWSWQLLDDVERSTLTELSVFPADFGLDAVERVVSAPNPIGTLRSLHTKSLVASAHFDHHTTRFRLLFGVRDFAQAHQAANSGSSPNLRRRLASAYADWFDDWTFEDQWASTEFLDVLLLERPAIREIMATADSGVDETSARVAAASAALYRYGIGITQGRTITLSSDLDALPDAVAARLALAGSEACYAFGDVDAKNRLASHAAERAHAATRSDLISIAISQQCVGRMLIEPDHCSTLLDDAIAHARSANSRRIESIALGLQAFCRLVDGNAPDASQLIDDAERLAAPSGWDRTSAATVRGIGLFLDGDRSGAAVEFETLTTSMQLVGLHAAAALFRLLEVTCRVDTAPDDEIRTVVEDFLREYRRATGHAGRADALLLFAHRAVRAGDVDRATTLLDALRGRRLAHQVSMLILNDVNILAGATPIDFSVASVVSPQSVPLLAELLDRELASLA